MASQRIFVAAAPVATIASAPFVVSEPIAIDHPGTLLITVVVDATIVVVEAVASWRIKPSIFQAADAVPPAACWRATTRIENGFNS